MSPNFREESNLVPPRTAANPATEPRLHRGRENRFAGTALSTTTRRLALSGASLDIVYQSIMLSLVVESFGWAQLNVSQVYQRCEASPLRDWWRRDS